MPIKAPLLKQPASCTARANRLAGVLLAFGINFFRGIKPLLLMNSTTKHTEALSVTQRARGLAYHFLNHLFSTSKSAACLNLFVNNWLNLFFTTEDTEALSATQKKQWGVVTFLLLFSFTSLW